MRTFSFFSDGAARKCAGGHRAERRLTVDEDVLPPDVVLVPAVVLLGVRVLQLRERGQGRRRGRRQQLRRRRRRPERRDGLMLVFHGASELTHRGRARRAACVRGLERRATARRARARHPPSPTTPRAALPPLRHQRPPPTPRLPALPSSRKT